jgi:ubiquinone/menaquinone biosynthesis C-methylase UbiE
MADVAQFWNVWAPYLSYIENNALDVTAIKKLDRVISDPVLIAGAGQGLLVEQLQKSGHKVVGIDLSPQMVKYALMRRGLTLIEADARRLPFADRTYSTTIIATGVVDMLHDEGQIGLIVNEARRATQDAGKVLVAFYGVHPAAERFARLIGVITDNGVLQQKKMYELTRLSPGETLKTLRKDYQIGVLRALKEALILQISLPRREKRAVQKLAELLKSADDPQALINAAVDMPYRSEDGIRALFTRLQLPLLRLFALGTCSVVQIGT